MLDLSLTHSPSFLMNSGVQELEETSVLLESESLVESEPELRITRSIFRTLLDQANPYCLMRVPSPSFEPDHALHAITQSRCFMVHLARASNLEIIHASWRRSCTNFGDGAGRSTLSNVYAYTGEVKLPIIQALLGYLHDISIHQVPKLDHRKFDFS